jgi:hypothetical protein
VPHLEFSLELVDPCGLCAERGHFGLERVLLLLKVLGLLALAFTRVVGSEAVALYALNAPLLLLVFGLGSLAGWQAGLRFREYLTPRLPLLDRLTF